MKQQLSHEYSLYVPFLFFGIGVGVGTLLFWLLGFSSSGPGRMIFFIVSFLMGISTLFYSLRFYNISFDAENMYFSRFGKKQHISLHSVTDIDVNVFPLKMFYLNSYIITIEYTEQDQLKKIKFISKGIPLIAGTVKEIPHLDMLRRSIKDKKYSK
jgi:hypothetical protein